MQEGKWMLVCGSLVEHIATICKALNSIPMHIQQGGGGGREETETERGRGRVGRD